MARTNLTLRTIRAVKQLLAKMIEHDEALDALEVDSVTTSITALSLVGRASDTNGVLEEITAADPGTVLRLNDAGDELVFDQVPEDGIADAAVTEDKIDDAAVTEAKIADAAVTTDKVDDAAVTAAKVDDAAFVSYVVSAGNGAGARTMTGAKVGDVVLMCVNLTDSTNDLGAGDVESVVTVADQLQQLQTNHTGDKWAVLVLAKGT